MICIIGSIAVLSLLLSTINILTAFSQNKLCRLRLLRGPVKHRATLQELSSRISKHRGVSDADDFGHILVQDAVGHGRVGLWICWLPIPPISKPLFEGTPIHEIYSTFHQEASFWIKFITFQRKKRPPRPKAKIPKILGVDEGPYLGVS